MLSVIFPTFNGADTLPLMLEAMCQLREPAGGWCLIAVDNASTDDTAAILRSYKDRLRLTILHEPSPGKSRALNRAMAHIEGDLVVFTDDDVIPEADWLTEWRTFADEHPQFGVFGGRITPHWLDPPPIWVLTAIPHGIAYAATHDNVTNGHTSPRNIAGPNMAIRTLYLRNGLRFNEAAGPTGAIYAMGEDTAFAYEAEARGAKAAHCSTARVGHMILKEQYSKGWLLRRAYKYGQSRGLAEGGERLHQHCHHVLTVPRWLLREYLALHARALISVLRLNPDATMSAAWEARYTAGYIQAYRNASSQSSAH